MSWCLLPSTLLFQDIQTDRFWCCAPGRLHKTSKSSASCRFRHCSGDIFFQQLKSTGSCTSSWYIAQAGLPHPMQSMIMPLALPAEDLILLAAFCTCLLPSLGSSNFDLLRCLTQSNFWVAELLELTQMLRHRRHSDRLWQTERCEIQLALLCLYMTSLLEKHQNTMTRPSTGVAKIWITAESANQYSSNCDIGFVLCCLRCFACMMYISSV